MTADRYSQRIPWVAIVLGGLALGVGAFVLLRLPPAPEPAARSAPQPVGLTTIGDGAVDASLREEIALQDPTPLFLPTEWNTSRATLQPDTQREPAGALLDFAPQLSFPDANPGVAFPLTVDVPASPEAALRKGDPAETAQAFGRRDEVRPAPLPHRFAALHVSLAATGESKWEDELPLGADAPAGDWAPVELLAAVGPGGLVGSPVLTASSGSEEIDLWLPRYLAKSYRLGERLRPGFYRILVGP